MLWYCKGQTIGHRQPESESTSVLTSMLWLLPTALSQTVSKTQGKGDAQKILEHKGSLGNAVDIGLIGIRGIKGIPAQEKKLV